MITIRPLEEKDVAAVSAIESRTFSMPWKEADFLEMVKADYAYYYVAEADGVILGCCGLRNMAGEGEITNVAVDAPFRRRGIARKLAAALGFRHIAIAVPVTHLRTYLISVRYMTWEPGKR